MHSLKDTPDFALEAVADARAESWRVGASAFPGILMAHLEIRPVDPGERFSFSVCGWTREEVWNRIECLRYDAAAHLRRRRGGRGGAAEGA